MELLNEMYKAREAGAAGTPRMEGSTGNLSEDAGSCRAAHRRGTVDESAGQAVFDPPASTGRKVDEAAAKEDTIELPVQINGKVRDRITVPADASEEEIKSAALASEVVQKYLEGKEPKKVIVANKRLVSVGGISSKTTEHEAKAAGSHGKSLPPF